MLTIFKQTPLISQTPKPEPNHNPPGLPSSLPLRLLLPLRLRHLLLILLVPLVPVSLRLVVLDLYAVLHFLCLDITKFLGLDDVGQVSSIAVAFELIEEVEFMLLQLLNPGIESTHRLKHLIMLSLKLGHIVFALLHFLV